MLEKDTQTDSFHAHLLIQLKKVPEIAINNVFKNELKKLKTSSDTVIEEVVSNEAVSTYVTKYFSPSSYYDILLPKSSCHSRNEMISRFSELAYNARNGDLKRAKVFLEIGNQFKSERWEVKSKEVNELVEFLLYESKPSDHEVIINHLNSVVSEIPSTNNYDVQPQDVNTDEYDVIRILNLLTCHHDLCVTLGTPQDSRFNA